MWPRSTPAIIPPIVSPFLSSFLSLRGSLVDIEGKELSALAIETMAIGEREINKLQNFEDSNLIIILGIPLKTFYISFYFYDTQLLRRTRDMRGNECTRLHPPESIDPPPQ